MGINFPSFPLVGDLWPSPAVAGQGQYTWDGEKWASGSVPASRASIYAAPFDAMAYNGMQINGSMEVSQENGSTAVGVTGAAKYILDGWRVVSIGAQNAVSAQRLTTLPPGYSAGLQIYFGSPANPSPAATDYCIFLHSTEGYRINRLAWGTANAQPVTIGFWVFATRTGTYSGSVRNGKATPDRSYVFTFSVSNGNTWEYKTVTIPGCNDGTWETGNLVALHLSIAMMAGTSKQTAAGAWTVGDFVGATGTTNGVAATTDTMIITGVVVLPGIEAPSAARSPLIMRPYDQELVTCQRYLWFSNKAVPASDLFPMMMFYATAADRGFLSGPQPAIPMRSNPSCTVWYNATTATWVNRTTGSTGAAPTFSPNLGGLHAYQYISGGAAANNTYSFDLKFDARL